MRIELEVRDFSETIIKHQVLVIRIGSSGIFRPIELRKGKNFKINNRTAMRMTTTMKLNLIGNTSIIIKEI